MQGTLSATYCVADIAKAIYVGRRSGILRLEKDEVRKQLFFEKGSFVFSDSNDPEWRLGQVLIRRGLVDSAALEGVLSEQGLNVRLGEAVIAAGLVDREAMAAAVEYQITENAFPVFSWSDGDFAFEEKDEPAPPDIALSFSTASLIMEGVRRIEDAAFIRTALGETDRVIWMASNPLLRFQSVFLRPEEGFVLSRIDGFLTIEQVCSVTPVPEDDVLRCLYGLESAGILEMRSAQETEQLDDDVGDVASFFSDFAGAEEFLGTRTGRSEQELELTDEEQAELEQLRGFADRVGTLDHYGILGVEPSANVAQVRRAYYQLAKKFHPDRHHRPHLAPMRDRLERVFVQINEAYETLRSERKRAAYEQRRRGSGAKGASGAESVRPVDPVAEAQRLKQLAEKSHTDGLRLFGEGELVEAVRAFRVAVQLAPEKPIYRADLGRALSGNPKWRKEAEENLLKAIELQPMHGSYYVQLGLLYEASDLSAKAERCFSQALRHNSDDTEAQAGLERVSSRGKRKGGAFKWFTRE